MISVCKYVCVALLLPLAEMVFLVHRERGTETFPGPLTLSHPLYSEGMLSGLADNSTSVETTYLNCSVYT